MNIIKLYNKLFNGNIKKIKPVKLNNVKKFKTKSCFASKDFFIYNNVIYLKSVIYSTNKKYFINNNILYEILNYDNEKYITSFISSDNKIIINRKKNFENIIFNNILYYFNNISISFKYYTIGYYINKTKYNYYSTFYYSYDKNNIFIKKYNYKYYIIVKYLYNSKLRFF